MKETNKLHSNTIISELLNTRHITRQPTEQTETSVSYNIPLGTHVNTTTKVSNPLTIIFRYSCNV